MTGAEHFRRVPRPDAPSGEQLVDELRAAAAARKMSLGQFCRPLAGSNTHPTCFIQQLLRTKCPRQATVDRVRAAISGAAVPAAERKGKHGDGPRRGRAGPADRRLREAPSARTNTTIPIKIVHRERTPEERLAEASDVVRFAIREWPDVAASVREYATETERSLGDAWLSVITAGLQCLRED